MAFVRWRGTCAQLLTSIYEQGRSRQVLLANLPDAYVSASLRADVIAKFPHIHVDWVAVDVALARGPANHSPVPDSTVSCAHAEHLLRALADAMHREGTSRREVLTLLDAADLLTSLRMTGTLSRLLPEVTHLSSDDRSRPPPLLP